MSFDTEPDADPHGECRAEIERLRGARTVLGPLLDAARALGGLPDGYCFCSRDRDGARTEGHEPECRDLRKAIADCENGF